MNRDYPPPFATSQLALLLPPVVSSLRSVRLASLRFGSILWFRILNWKNAIH